MSRRGGIIFSLVIALSLAGLLPQTSAQQSTITVVWSSDVPTLDVANLATYSVRTIQGNISDTLFHLDKKMKIVPSLALSWESINPTTWRIRLRKGVRFHNGEPFDANAVKFSLERAAAPRSAVGFYVRQIQEVKVVDDSTVDIVTKTPNPLTIPNLVMIYIVPPKYVDQAGDAFGSQPVGTGPFRFVQWRKGDSVVLAANRQYWGGAPKVDRVVIRFVPEATTRVAMLLKGEADLIVDVPPELASVVARGANSKLLRVLGFRRIYLSIDGRPGSSPPFDNPKVRQALVFAIDRQSIIKNILLVHAKAYGGYTNHDHPGVDPALVPPPYDPERAKKLLSEAGFPNGFETTITTPVGAFPKDKEIAQAIADQLAKIGVRAKVETLEFGDYSRRFVGRQLKGLVFARRGGNTGDPADHYLFFLTCNAPANYLCDQKLDEEFEKMQATLDMPERYAMFKKSESYLVNQLVPEVPLFDLEDLYGLSKRLDWEPANPREFIDLRGIKDVR